MRFTKIGINMMLAFSSIVLILLAAEGALRVAGYSPLYGVIEGTNFFIQRSSTLERIYEARPSSEGFGWGANIKINSHGFRDREYDIEKRPGIFRIAVLGDSVTFGFGLNEQDLFTFRAVAEAREKGREIEVINMGLVGYDTLQEVATLESVGLKLNPDMVALSYVFNDIGFGSAELPILDVEDFESPIYRIRLVQMLYVLRYIAEENSEVRFTEKNKDYIVDIGSDDVLLKLMDRLEEELESNGSYLAGMLGACSKLYTSRAHVGKLRYSLERLKNVEGRNGFTVVALVFPMLPENEQGEKIYRLAYRIIEHEMKRVGFEIIDLYEAYQSAGFDTLRQTAQDDLHPNVRGHALAAKIFSDYIENSLFASRDIVVAPAVGARPLEAYPARQGGMR